MSGDAKTSNKPNPETFVRSLHHKFLVVVMHLSHNINMIIRRHAVNKSISLRLLCSFASGKDIF